MLRTDLTLPVFSTDAMREADRATIEEFGLPGFTLMETAARGATDVIEARCGPLNGKTALVLAGKGNNGGDGLAIARHLATRGADVTVITLADEDGATESSVTEGGRRNLALLRAMETEGPCALTVAAGGTESGPTRPFDIAIDALLGIGASGPLREPLRSLALLCRNARTTVAIDIPTGIDSDTGAAHDEAAVRADFTVTMAAPKPGLLFGAGREHAGDVVPVDIGIPPHIAARALAAEGSARIATDAFVRASLPERPTDAHKNSVGLALVVAGSDAYTGAAVLASLAAGRMGAGYVTCITTPATQTAIDAQSPPTATVAVATTDSGGIAGAAAEEIVSRCSNAGALLIGPGLGRDPETARMVREVLARVDLPVVIDADGLNALCDGGAGDGGLDEFPAETRARWVLTPHLGEFRRLVQAAGVDPETLDLERRTWLVREWAARLGVTLLLKGAPTVTATPDGVTFVASSVEPALASAGTGDVLAGMIVGLLAQGASGIESAVCAQHIGAAIARTWGERNAERSLQPTDVIEALPQVMRERFEFER